jgi:hypothetical protein
MKPFANAVAAVAALSFAVPLSAQTDRPSTTGKSPRLGKPAAQTTGRTSARIKRASGGGVPHGPRHGDGKVRPSASAKAGAGKTATR